MAIIKRIDLPETGAQIAYWRVKAVTVARDHAVVEIEGFVSSQVASQEGKQPLAETRKKIIVTGGPFTTYFSNDVLAEVGKNPMSQGYAFLGSSVAEDRKGQPFDLTSSTPG